MVDEVGRGPSQAVGLIEKMESCKFAFILKLMLKLFGITNESFQKSCKEKILILCLPWN
jgi:hypothetical protein